MFRTIGPTIPARGWARATSTRSASVPVHHSVSGFSSRTYGATVSRIPWFHAGRQEDVLSILDETRPRMGGDRLRVAAVVRRVVDHQHVDVDLAAMGLEGRQAAFEVVPGVEVHDDDGELRLAGSGHRWGVCATSTMPTMMKNTPAQRSEGNLFVQQEPVGEQDQHVRERRERVRERERGAREHREPHDRGQPEQEETRPDRGRRHDILDGRRREREHAGVVGDLVHAVLQRELGAGGEQHGEQDQSDQHGGLLPFRSGDVLGRSGWRSQVLDLGFDDDFDVLLHARHLDHLEQVPLRLHVEQLAGRARRQTDRDPVLAGRCTGTTGSGSARASSRRTDRSRCPCSRFAPRSPDGSSLRRAPRSRRRDRPPARSSGCRSGSSTDRRGARDRRRRRRRGSTPPPRSRPRGSPPRR